MAGRPVGRGPVPLLQAFGVHGGGDLDDHVPADNDYFVHTAIYHDGVGGDGVDCRCRESAIIMGGSRGDRVRRDHWRWWLYGSGVIERLVFGRWSIFRSSADDNVAGKNVNRTVDVFVQELSWKVEFALRFLTIDMTAEDRTVLYLAAPWFLGAGIECGLKEVDVPTVDEVAVIAVACRVTIG